MLHLKKILLFFFFLIKLFLVFLPVLKILLVNLKTAFELLAKICFSLTLTPLTYKDVVVSSVYENLVNCSESEVILH